MEGVIYPHYAVVLSTKLYRANILPTENGPKGTDGPRSPPTDKINL